MTFLDSIKSCLDKYFTMKGRAPRSEYWWFVLFQILMVLLTTIVCGILGGKIGGIHGLTIAISVGNALLYLGLLCPYVCVTVRRLHDTGHSGYWLLLPMGLSVLLFIITFLQQQYGLDKSFANITGSAYFIGCLWILFFLLKGSDEENEYGLPVY